MCPKPVLFKIDLPMSAPMYFPTAVLPLYFSILPAVVFAGLKESADLLRGGAFKDSFVDWTFQCVGAFFCIVLSIKNFDLVNLSVGFIILSLAFGLIPRVKKLFTTSR
jgi:hypothetical protein